ncbi:conserved hypothetical protein [Burkholderia mallei PRL-20]|nr:hypothetical protein BMASAVP1_A0909 [Burkholderia mallei SAVP1]ABO05137.1 hypothetical protein BMA10247_1865 [Burkholderia mallei NCTC 10247]EDK53605.1 hypothetical protein BMAFMH_0234 [Burkholderia mallei FMH]EDK58575.1 hypothetical protein BMAJHU_0234 [Burkholderia mallei JHU]EDK83636.1 hypothetical protein BMA721280_B0038 [Burkholderia mallei 2002721280]EDP86648.1 hypothetical protein BMA10399_C0278 [Burkholderia mallei ATCC 10399]EEP88741.1 conserved hypothetical protein [Burkholderia 
MAVTSCGLVVSASSRRPADDAPPRRLANVDSDASRGGEPANGRTWT